MVIVGQGITAYPIPDDALNENSKNPVQNKVIAGNIKELKNNNVAQDERIAGLGQATTATTIGPASIATFEAPTANMPLKELTVNIEPVQAAGTPTPETPLPITGWAIANIARCGKNFLPLTLESCKELNTSGTWSGNTYTFNNGTFTVLTDDSGTITGIIMNGTFNNNTTFGLVGGVKLPVGNYILSGCPSGGGTNTFRLRLTSSGTNYNDYGSGLAIAVNDKNRSYLAQMYCKYGVAYDNVMFTPMLRLSTDSSTYELYKGNTYDITFPTEAGTVYGGTLDVMSGKLSVEYASLTLPNADSIRDSTVVGTGKWVRYSMPRNTSTDDDTVNAIGEKLKGVNRSSTEYRDVWTIQTYLGSSNRYLAVFVPADYTLEQIDTAIAGSQIIYKLANPIVYNLSDIPEITTLLGTNNIWADCGDVTVIHGVYLEAIKELSDEHDVREEKVEGTVINLNAEPNTRYICSEVATLDITLPASGICDIVFTSGSTPTVLTVSSTVKWMHGFDPTALAADTIYELNIMDGLGVVISWT